MNCSEWRRLLGGYLDDVGLDEDQRRGLVEHFSGCPDCRREELEADPILLFLGASPLELDSSEVASINSTVRAMRRVRDLETPRPRMWPRAGRVAAAAVLLTGLLLLPGGDRRLAAPGPSLNDSGTDTLSSGWGELARVSVWESPGLIENLDRPEARVYQLSERDLSLVMIVDESLDL